MAEYEDGYDPKYGYNKNAFQHKPPQLIVLGKVVKLLAAPFGLASELLHERKDHKAAASQPHEQEAKEDVYVRLPPDQADTLIEGGQAVPAEGAEPTHEIVPDGEAVDHDEQDWALDELAASDDEDDASEAPPPEYTPWPEGTINARSVSPGKLPFPIILPQRRPRTKTRGFVRAYAPVLEDCGIDQTTFLRFLKDLHTHAQASPVFDVLSIAAGVAGIYPDILIASVAQAVQTAVMVGQEAQERWRTNKFLDQMNKDLFIPKGLYALIAQYEHTQLENTEVGTKTVDLGSQAFAAYGDKFTDSHEESEGSSGWKEKKDRLRLASGKTHGEAEMPLMCAPLVFPAIDSMAQNLIDSHNEGKESSSAVTFKEKAKGASKWLADYFDRRAQADFEFNNPDSTLSKAMGDAAPKFKSKMADPNDHRNKHLLTLITGGKYKAEPLGARRRWEKAQRKLHEQRARGLREKPQKRILQEGVLYLMICNMPTQEQLEKAKEEIKQKQFSKAG